MPAIELPNGASAILRDRGELTERAVRAISRAQTRAVGTLGKLLKAGFDDNDPATYGAYSDLTPEDEDNLDGFQAVLIVTMLSSWSLDKELPTVETVLDLPKPLYDALATGALNEFNRTLDLDPSLDPKAPSADLTA